MQTLWTENKAVKVACTVAYPDPAWVRDLGNDAASVFVDEDEAIMGVSDRSISHQTAPSDPTGPTLVYRSRGHVLMTLEVRLRAKNETRLNELGGQFRDAFPMGYAFGPEGLPHQFQLASNPRGARVRPREDEERRIERIYRFVVRGPWEETGEAYPVETMAVKVAP
jgi:hypothetical protein